MYIGILKSTNNACEITQAVKHANMTPIEFLSNASCEKLSSCSGFIITDEFFCEEQMRVLQMIKEQSELGKPILGIENGSRVLVESGLIPGVEDHKAVISFEASHPSNPTDKIYLTDGYQYNAFTRHLKPKHVLHITQSVNQFIIPPALLLEMRMNGLNIFQYADDNREDLVNNIAAISNKNGNVMAMIPRLEYLQEGRVILTSMRDYIVKGYKQHAKPLAYYPRKK